MSRSARPWVLATLAGLALFLSQPPAAAWPTAFLVLPLLLAAVLDAPRGRDAALAGLVTGLAGYGPMLVWLVLPAGYLGWSLLTLTQAIAVALTGWVLWRWIDRPAIVAVAPVVWTGMEAWRAAVPLGGFGWGELGYALVDSAWILPLARLGGARLLTLVTALLGVLLFDVYRRGRQQTEGLLGPVQDRVAAALPHAQPALLGLAATLVVVAVAAPEAPPTSGTLDVLAVQGNDMLVSTLPAAEEDRVIARNLRDETLASVAAEGAPDLVVWPESGVDRDPTTATGADLRPFVTETAAAAGRLVTGTILDGDGPGTFRNASLVVDADGTVTDRYVKRHLVPFGEFVPWRSVLGRIPALDQVPRDGLPGEAPTALAVDGVHVGVAICFETLFPRLVRENLLAGDEPAELILATTNDASFGDSAEPAQHLAQSRMRAVETGRWVVHASLTGGAAFVDPEGRAHDVTPLFTIDSIRREVPLAAGTTPYLRAGDVAGWSAQVLAALLLAATLVRRRRITEELAS